MHHRFTIVGLGEALFDIFAGEERLGGAPLNVAVHAHQLAQLRGGRGVLVSRVGQDDLGRTLIDQLRDRGMDTRYIQRDPDRPTGQVFVDTDAAGQPHYDIVRDSAWDMLWFDSDLEDLAMTCNAVCFGSLAQREAQTRNAIYRFLDTCRRATRLFDVNLRPPFYEPRILRRSFEKAEIVKMNEDELPTVCEQVGLGIEMDEPTGDGDTNVSSSTNQTGDADRQGGIHSTQRARAEGLRRKYGLEMLVLTRGERGTAALTEAGWHEGEAADYPFAEHATAVGAGDATTAGVLLGQVLHFSPEKTLTLANHLGGNVVAHPQATPELPENILRMVNG